MRIGFSHKMTAAFIIGAGTGLWLGPKAGNFQLLGDIFIQALRIVSWPIVAFTILDGLSHSSLRQATSMGVHTAAVFIVLTSLAVVAGVTLAGAMHPGKGMITTAPAAPRTGSVGSWADASLLICIALSIAMALYVQRHRSRRLQDFFATGARMSQQALAWIMIYAPVATVALVAITFGQYRSAAVRQFANLILTVYAAQLVVTLICLAVLALYGYRPDKFVAAVKEPLVTAFITGSSAATMPVEIEAAANSGKLGKETAGFVIPLGISTNKIGSAVHLAVTSVFAADIAGIELGFGKLTLIAIIAGIASIATPPISGGVLVVLGAMFQQLGLPLQAIALIASAPFLGKWNTSLNSFGRLVSAAVVARVIRRGAADRHVVATHA